MTADVYKYMAADNCLKQFTNMMTLFKMALLIPPTTSIVEHGFSVINLFATEKATQQGVT